MEWVSQWAQGIVVAVIIATILEMIIPKGNSKKYIKVVIGVYVVFTIISPIINKINGKEISIENFMVEENIETLSKQETNNSIMNENQKTIQNVYQINLESDLKSRLKEKGYRANNIQIKLGEGENYTMIESIFCQLERESEELQEESGKEINVVKIDEIKINSSNESKNIDKENRIEESEKEEIKKYLMGIYELNEENIIIQ